jgi:hypothetical protein
MIYIDCQRFEIFYCKFVGPEHDQYRLSKAHDFLPQMKNPEKLVWDFL